MSATPPQVRESAVRRAAHAVLVAAVRGRRERGGDWGEAVLAEFAETRGDWEAVRWAAGGLRAAWQERRGLSRPISFTRRAIAVGVVSIVAGLLVNQFVLTVGYVASGSMEPTQLIGDRYLLDKVSFRLTGIHRGDLVLITDPAAGSPPVARVKRVIGLPGDTIECRDGRVWRNGRALDERYLANQLDDTRTDCDPVTVPSNELYLLGDHRLVSQDSRQSGPVSESAVDGRVLTRVWPFQR